MQKLIIIAGPTASGKTSLSIKLAKKFNSEIISADSRQIYKNLRIGSAVVTKKEASGIKHHLIEFLSPNQKFSAGKFSKLAHQKIKEINAKNKLPMVVGGTGFYIEALLNPQKLSPVKVNLKLRQKLSKLSHKELFKILKKLDHEKTSKIDSQNSRRLIRAIEIASAKPTKPLRTTLQPDFQILFLGVSQPWPKLKKRIEKRFFAQLEAGFLKEVQKLIKQGLKKSRFKEFGLQYWLAWQYLKKQINYEEFCQKCLFSLFHYAKRQNTWFKRNHKIIWVKNYSQAEKLARKFLQN